MLFCFVSVLTCHHDVSWLCLFRRFMTGRSTTRTARPIPPAKPPRCVGSYLHGILPLIVFCLSQPAVPFLSHQDVSTFLAWCSEPEADERKVRLHINLRSRANEQQLLLPAALALRSVQVAGTKVLIGIAIAAVFAGYWKRFRWSALKNRRITFK